MKDTLWEQIFLGEDSDGTEIKEETMIRKLRTFALIASCLVVYSQAAFSQGVPSTVLQIDVENFVRYVEDISDPSKFATNPNVTPASVPKNFGAFIAIADIVAVNGQPAKGTFSTRGRVVNLRPAPNPGEAIADTNRNVEEDMRFEILNVDGTAVGTIVGLEVGGGPPPPGAPLAVTQGNNALVGGTGAFFGARGFFGQAVTSQSVPSRMASMAEDPANRRRNGGGKARMVLQVIPMELPQIVVNAGFPQIPLVMHLGGFLAPHGLQSSLGGRDLASVGYGSRTDEAGSRSWSAVSRQSGSGGKLARDCDGEWEISDSGRRRGCPWGSGPLLCGLSGTLGHRQGIRKHSSERRMDSRICGGYSDPVNWLRQVEIACSRTLAWAIGVLLPNDGFMGVTRLFPSNLTVLDHLLFWTAADLELKLSDFKNYYNTVRVHASLENQTPIPTGQSKRVDLKCYAWQKHCRGLYQTPKAA